jgi:alkylation response protein AidB-like acyl-CoA dehydrogenase
LSLGLIEQGDGPMRSWTIAGVKAFCTGAELVDRALVTVPTDTGSLLFDIDARAGDSIAYDTTEWVASAFADTRTATATFRDVQVGEDDLVGTPGWYVERNGFWHGAIGPAACWAGGAAGLVDAAHAALAGRTDPITNAGIGALVALRWRLEQLLDGAGREIDAHPGDLVAARRRALVCRHEIDTATGEIVDRYARLVGPRPLAFDAAVVARVAEVELYRRQSHAEHDLAQVGGELRENPTGR